MTVLGDSIWVFVILFFLFLFLYVLSFLKEWTEKTEEECVSNIEYLCLPNRPSNIQN